ncbi:hypothetical protein [Empedobacter brevis]|uniref:hypothetical protein n=1 Tax=Empedobacter brevis TaxID=247 RepID=UPI0028D1FB4B|nr:hypothetical protein [Empedobacter brevis]
MFGKYKSNSRFTSCSSYPKPTHKTCKRRDQSKGERMNWEKSTSTNTTFNIIDEEGRMLESKEFTQNTNNLLVP